MRANYQRLAEKEKSYQLFFLITRPLQLSRVEKQKVKRESPEAEKTCVAGEPLIGLAVSSESYKRAYL